MADYQNPYIDQSSIGLSPEAIQARRRYAYGVMQQISDGSPTKANAIGAIARALQGAMGGYMVGQADKDEMQGINAQGEMLATLAGGVSPGGSAQAPAATNVAPTSAPTVPDQYKPTIQTASTQYGIPPAILARQLQAESNFNPNATSPVGAQGIAQFMPATAKDMGVNPLDPNSAIPGAAQYLKQNLDRYGGDMTKALAAYNWGPGNVDKWSAAGANPAKLPAETQNYIAKILGPQALQGGQSQAQSGPQLAGQQPTPDNSAPQGQPQSGIPQNPGTQQLINVIRDPSANVWQKREAAKMLQGIVTKQLSADWKPVQQPDGSLALVNAATGEVRHQNDPDMIRRIAEKEAATSGAAEAAKLAAAKASEAAGLKQSGDEVKRNFPLLIDDATKDLTSPSGFIPKTGQLASQSAKVSGTPAANLQAKLEAIRSAAAQAYEEERKLANPTGRPVSPEAINDYKKQLILDVGDPKQTAITLERLKQKYGTPAAGTITTGAPAPRGSAVAAPAPLKSGTYNWTPQGLVPQ